MEIELGVRSRAAAEAVVAFVGRVVNPGAQDPVAVPSDSPRWEVAYMGGTGFDFMKQTHLDGVAWHDAPIPRPKHECVDQTRTATIFEFVGRCSCGSIRRNDGPWYDKNSRK